MPRPPDNKLRPAWTAAVPDHVIGVSWSPDGKALAAAAVSGPVTVFDAGTDGVELHCEAVETTGR